MSGFGYNIFVMGEPGLGRLSMLLPSLGTLAKTLPAPPSYAYGNNFANAREPVAVVLPAGQGQTFAKAIDQLLENLLTLFPAVFESPMYQQKKNAIERRFNQAYNKALDLVDSRAQDLGIALFREHENLSFVPVQDGKAVSDEDFSRLSQPERERFHQNIGQLEEYLAEVLLELPQWRSATAEAIRDLDNDTINQAIEPLFLELQRCYQHSTDATAYLEAVHKHLIGVITDCFMPGSAMENQSLSTKKALLAEQYAPNILLDNLPEDGAPVIYEAHPTYQNLFGRIEYVQDQGALATSYRRIYAGSLHRANGGYLVLDAEPLLRHPYVWEALKRALKAGCIEIESPHSELGIHAATLNPKTISLKIKVILLGPADIYYLLQDLDSEFKEMFKVLAEFSPFIGRNKASTQQFVHLMTAKADNLGGRPLACSALEALIEYSCRLAENQNHFSARINDVLELVGEANFFSQRQGADTVDRSHIQQALAAREHRNGRLAEEMLDDMLDGTILIDTQGMAVGKINGLTVMEVGGSSFGAPARITTTVSPGSRGIIDIEREAELGQSIHSKGVMILTGYLGHFYARQFPLTLSASIAIEQSYGLIDGDSAALAELCCLISALTDTPIKQSLAVTGSINQYGEVQAIGGINEKIEGFFKLCKARGLEQGHGVIIPAANQRHLMLGQAVVDAVADGLFAVYAVTRVNQALALLTGQTAGALNERGAYPEGSINAKAVARLKEMSDIASDEEKEDGVG